MNAAAMKQCWRMAEAMRTPAVTMTAREFELAPGTYQVLIWPRFGEGPNGTLAQRSDGTTWVWQATYDRWVRQLA